MLLIVTGMGTALYLLTAIAEQVVEGRFRDLLGRNAMQRRIEQLEGHVIVYGFGRLGRVVAGEIAARRVPLVIADADPGKEPDLVRLGVPYLIGSALSDEILERPGCGGRGHWWPRRRPIRTTCSSRCRRARRIRGS